MLPQGTIVRALLLGEGLDLKGLERQDAFSINPLAFNTSANGTAMLFKFGAVVFFNCARR
jgi:required for meiotic nuclear division protein 1